jgi:ABC-2 type transport system ATP-binding protein
VLDDISLEVRRGEIFGLLGPNGAGKTTLLKMLATLLLPDRGSIRIGGIDALADPLGVKRLIGMSMADDRAFYWRLSARYNLEFFGTLAGVEARALAPRIAEVVDLVDLAASIDLPISAYSSGMRQRLAVARALIADPEILVFDEPTRAVDPMHALELRDLIRETLSKKLGKTILVSTNILEEAWSVCDRIAILSAGKVAALGSPEALAARYADKRRYAIAFEELDDALVERLLRVPGVDEVERKHTSRGEVLVVGIELQGRNLTDLLAALGANGSAVRGIREVDDALFDVFRATTVPARE